MKYQLLKIYNNNAILVRNLKNMQEAFLVGKGIGFGKRAFDVYFIDRTFIEKHFITYDDTLKKEYFNLLEGINDRIFTLVLEVMEVAQIKLGALNPRTPLVLADHISFMFERIKQNHDFINPFADEIRLLYPEEYEVALLAKTQLDKEFNINVSEDEVGFFTLHLYAARKNIVVSESVKGTRVIKELIAIIETQLQIIIRKDLDYSRLMYHLRSCIERAIEGKQVKNPMLDMIKKDLFQGYEVALKLRTKIESNFDVKIIDDEVAYMAIHIYRLMNNQ